MTLEVRRGFEYCELMLRGRQAQGVGEHCWSDGEGVKILLWRTGSELADLSDSGDGGAGLTLEMLVGRGTEVTRRC
jgi:hypothetical protein